MADQLELAYGDRHAGQEANLAAGTTGHRDHRTIVEVAIAVCARNHRPFTADDVHHLVAHEIPGGYDRNLVSSVMGQWAAQHRILRQPGLTPSTNRARKGSRNGWWLGNRSGDTGTAPLPRAASA
jgi:hypothetical protein